MHVIAEASGTRLVERGGQWLALDMATGALSIVVFVLGLITFIGGINGIVWLATGLANAGGHVLGGLVVIAIAGLVGFALSRAVMALRRRRSAPNDQLPIKVIFDFDRGQLLNSQGAPLAPLTAVRVDRRLHIGSSAPRLVACWPGGAVEIVKGSPFAGGVSEIESALKAKLGRR